MRLLRAFHLFPRPAKRHSPFSVPWASSRWDVPGTPPGIQEASGIDARGTSTGSSRCGGAAALLRAPPWMAELLTPSLRECPASLQEAHFSCLYPGSCSFSYF
ncbi:hypothetical protein XENOCAPTIV_022135 [Xenoophorus captivus]|uniref:Uncharacterized protein n=1 Tax=Xenoophorus captivus TaxID=1517983 RepID=A0ABV0QB83_9TELE